MSELRFFSCAFTLLATVAFWVTAFFTVFYAASVGDRYPHTQNPYYPIHLLLVLVSIVSTVLTISVWEAAWKSLDK